MMEVLERSTNKSEKQEIPGMTALGKRDQNVGAIISLLAIALLLMYISLAVVGTGNEGAILSTIGIDLLCSTGLCLLVLRKYRKVNKPLMIDYLNVGTQRYILALFMIMYGVDKVLGNFFDYQLFALDSKLSDVSEFQLAWFFYGKSRWQELFTGIMELVPALFLLRRKTYYVAALVLLPVTAQVFLLNLFFKIGGVTFPASVILLACNGYIIYSQKEKIMLFFRSLNFNIVDKLTGSTETVVKILKRIGIFLVCFVVFVKVRPVVFQSVGQKKYKALVGVYTLKEVKKNGVVYVPTASDSVFYKDLYIEKQDRWNILRRADNRLDAFVLEMHAKNDSVRLYINKGGTGDGANIIDSTTVLSGVYQMTGSNLVIKGVQMKDAVELVYERQDRIKPKKWFW